MTPFAILTALNSGVKKGDPLYRYAETPDRAKVQIIARYPSRFISIASKNHEHPRWTMRRLKLPGLDEVLIVAVHLIDIRNNNYDSRASQCLELGRAIREVEDKLKHRRTVLVGDFNLNPFDPPFIDAKGLHAVVSRKHAESGSRLIGAESYPFFYNPMWNFFGDATGPPGTLRYGTTEQVAHFWHMFDQVLVRPDLLGSFRTSDVQILSDDGVESFLTPSGNPKDSISDHLPIVFKLNL